jgi:hypothetical protein
VPLYAMRWIRSERMLIQHLEPFTGDKLVQIAKTRLAARLSWS